MEACGFVGGGMFSLSEFSDYDKLKSMILYQRNTSL